MRRALLPLALLTAGSAQAEEALKISGSVRLRYEALEGQARAGFGESDDLVSLRTVVLAEYRLDNDLRVAAELYDSAPRAANRTAPSARVRSIPWNLFRPMWPVRFPNRSV